MINKYINTVCVSAIQFNDKLTGIELSEIIKNTESKYSLWTTSDGKNETNDRLVILDTIFSVERSVAKGDYVVKFDGKNITIINKANFEKCYSIIS